MNQVLPRFLYSRSRQDAQAGFAKEPVLTVQVWRAAQLILESGLMDHLVEEDIKPNVYMLSSAAFEYVKKVNAVNRTEYVDNLVHMYKAVMTDPSSQSEFYNLIDCSTSVYVLTPLPEPLGAHVHFSCTCIMYARGCFCKHTLALGLFKQLTVAPANRLLKAIGQVAVVGRPPKAGRALEREASQYYTQNASQYIETQDTDDSDEDPCDMATQ